MKRPIRVNGKTLPTAAASLPEIGLSITNQRGEHHRCRAKGVTLRITRGIVQLIDGRRGCLVWFDRCRVELRDGHRKVLYRLLAGSASSDATGLTIVAEVVGDIGGTVKEERAQRRLRRGLASDGATNTKPPCPCNAADVNAA